MHNKIKVNIARIKLYVHVPLIKNVSAQYLIEEMSDILVYIKIYRYHKSICLHFLELYYMQLVFNMVILDKGYIINTFFQNKNLKSIFAVASSY